jgi:energy-coupling factor transport system permease protein
MMNISIAIFPILFDRFERTKAAQNARGIDFVQNPFHSIPALAIPLLKEVIRDTEERTLAMENRNNQGTLRTSMYELSMQKKDWIALFILILFSIFVLNL